MLVGSTVALLTNLPAVVVQYDFPIYAAFRQLYRHHAQPGPCLQPTRVARAQLDTLLLSKPNIIKNNHAFLGLVEDEADGLHLGWINLAKRGQGELIGLE